MGSSENNGLKLRTRRMSGSCATERSAYFARREAAKVLRCVLQGDTRRRVTASIKSLVYSPSVRNKKATFALVCQTLKYLPVLKNVLAAANVLSTKWKKQAELMYVTAYDVLFGQKIGMTGLVEKFVMAHKAPLQSALTNICANNEAKNVDQLSLGNRLHVLPKPRYVRVNTLKIDIGSARRELERIVMVKEDDVVSDILVLPHGTDLHSHRMVLNGSIFLQGKASSMVAAALSPKPGWKVLDACAAPGNKTAHLAALLNGKGEIIACEINKKRLEYLKDTISRSGAHNVKIINRDFLDINARDPPFSQVRAILLDPSCSGSGISAERLDYLLPSYSTDKAATVNNQRIKKLAGFQKKALAHSFSFPSVERIVYSTCSIHQAENEDVVESVLPLAASLNFELATPFPRWSRRGLPVFDGAESLLRTDPSDEMEGFFIALFVKKPDSKRKYAKQVAINHPFLHTKISMNWMRRCNRGTRHPCSKVC